MKQLLRTLTESFGPSGYEDEIRKTISEEIRSFVDELRVDALGNLIAHKKPSAASKNPKKLMIAAHMDEIGLMVTHVDENGFVRFTGIGAVYPRNLAGSHVRFANGTRGVVWLEPTASPSDFQPLSKMFIDVGAASRKDCPLKTGDVGAFERPFIDLGDRIVAKSMDDRIGCLVAIEALRALKSTPHDVYVVFTTQEEVGTHGAQTSAFGINPDLGFAIDVTGWGDTPGQKDFDVALGKGPAIKIRDGGMLSDPRIVDWMVSAAEKAKIPYQREVLLGGTTDARAMQLVHGGVPVGCISIPCRFVHSPSEVVDVKDVENTVRLVTTLLSRPLAW